MHRRALEQGLRHLQDLEWALPSAASAMLASSAFKAAVDIAEEHRAHRARNAAGFGAQHSGGDMFRVVLASMRQYLELHAYIQGQLASGVGGADGEVITRRDSALHLTLRDFEHLAPMLAQWGILVNDPPVTFSSLDTSCTGFIPFDTLCRWAQRLQLDVLSGGEGEGAAAASSPVRWPPRGLGVPSPREAAASISARAAALREGVAAARSPPGAPMDDPIAGASMEGVQLIGASAMASASARSAATEPVHSSAAELAAWPTSQSAKASYGGHVSGGPRFFTEDAPRLSVAEGVSNEVYRSQAEVARMREHCVLLSRHNKRLTLEIGRLVAILESRGGSEASLAKSPYRSVDLRGTIPAPSGFGTDRVRLKPPIEPHRRAPPPPLSSKAANSLSTQNLHVVARELWERENPLVRSNGQGDASRMAGPEQLAEDAVDRAVEHERGVEAESRLIGAAERELAAVEREREAFALERERLLVENERMTAEIEKAANEVWPPRPLRRACTVRTHESHVCGTIWPRCVPGRRPGGLYLRVLPAGCSPAHPPLPHARLSHS
jgi:hypothetical protein